MIFGIHYRTGVSHTPLRTPHARTGVSHTPSCQKSFPFPSLTHARPTIYTFRGEPSNPLAPHISRAANPASGPNPDGSLPAADMRPATTDMQPLTRLTGNCIAKAYLDENTQKRHPAAPTFPTKPVPLMGCARKRNNQANRHDQQMHHSVWHPSPTKNNTLYRQPPH